MLRMSPGLKYRISMCRSQYEAVEYHVGLFGVGLMSMKDVGSWALNVCDTRGVEFADLRIVSERNRGLATKNGKMANASDSESMGIGIRVLADGAWGFAASDDLAREAVEITARRAIEIARASARVKVHDV